MLCSECNRSRFPPDSDATSAKVRMTSISRKSNTSHPDTQLNTSSSQQSQDSSVTAADATVGDSVVPTIINPLLAYMWYAMQSGTASNIRDTVLGHFTLDVITEAKNDLWNNSPAELIGDKPRRKDSTVRSEQEAHVQDILSALTKLDKSEQMPRILLEATSLAIIPRFHPEEINGGSLAHRITLLEEKVH